VFGNKEKVKLETVEVARFSNGLPVACRFKNGFACPVCGELTEHKEQDGFRICAKCGRSKPYFVSTQMLEPEQVLEIKLQKRADYFFSKTIISYSVSIEIEAITPLLRRKSLSLILWNRMKNGFPSYEFEVD
jgi:ribosomal protein L37AE/L43A